MKRWEVVVGDCVEVLASMPESSVDAVVTDPPYGLEFMGKDWDSFRPANARMRTRVDERTNGAAKTLVTVPEAYRAGQPFQAWTETWAAEALRVLKPGGHLLAFGGTRTAHRLVAGLEDAGFEIRDTLMWLFGSGFPKSLNLDGERAGRGTALKPAHEPITLARKPLSGTVRATVEQHGTGALNIDACRLATVSDGPGTTPATAKGNERTMEGADMVRTSYDGSAGRWPANVVLDEDAAAALDEQTGTLTSGRAAEGGHRRNTDKTRTVYGRFEGQVVEGDVLYGDSGGASRFFYVAKPDRAERQAGLGAGAGLFSPVDAPERNDHPTVKPIDLMRWLIRLVTPPGGTVLDPFAGSGTTGCAAALEDRGFVGIEREEAYAAIARARLAHWSSGAAA